MRAVHMLWVSGVLGVLEQGSVASFLSRGYSVNVWTYGGVTQCPAGAKLRDAREVLPESSLFLNQLGTYAGFSDLFRYAVLRKFGGLYSDMDVIALRPAAELPQRPFMVTERTRQGGTKINGNVLHVPDPTPGNIVDLAYAYASVFPKAQLSWGEIGPDLLTAIATIHPRHGFDVMVPAFANPIDWWNCPIGLLEDRPVPDSFFLHLYNDMWRRAGRDKNQAFPARSMLERVWKTF